MRDTELLGYYLPAGTPLMVWPGMNHRLPELWTEPEKYDPERFAEPRTEHKKHRYAFAPFGGGAHKCIGMVFSQLEMKTVIHRLLRRYRLELARPGYQPHWDYGGIPSPWMACRSCCGRWVRSGRLTRFAERFSFRVGRGRNRRPAIGVTLNEGLCYVAFIRYLDRFARQCGTRLCGVEPRGVLAGPAPMFDATNTLDPLRIDADGTVTVCATQNLGRRLLPEVVARFIPADLKILHERGLEARR